jgi:CRP/FNR family transcriptional regulator, cyclic AMP receptor protein
MPCDPALLAKINLFEFLDEDDRNILANSINSVTVPEGRTLFEAGQPGESLFLIDSGEIELFIIDNVGQKIVLAVARKGDFFGELSLLDSGPRSATAVALTDSELLTLSRDDLILLFRKRPEAALDILAAVGGMTRNADQLLRTRVSRNVNDEMQEHQTGLQKIADWIAWFSGSMPFLLINTLWFTVWIAINTLPLGIEAFDPFPFGLLTMIVSLEAIFLSCFVLISQNRQAEKDHVRSDIEYEVNIKAELEVANLHEKTDRLHEDLLERFARLEKMIRQNNSN